MKIGEIIPADREITLNEGKNTVKILVANKGDRPVQVGSHYHFFEVNKSRPEHWIIRPVKRSSSFCRIPAGRKK